MSLKDVLSKKLTPELMLQITDALGDDFDYDMVPRTRLNKVIAQRNDLKAVVEGTAKADPTAKAPGAKAEDGDDPEGDAPILKGLVPEKALNDLKAQHEQALKDMRVQFAALDKLRAANAIDPDLILKSGVLDMTKIVVDDKGAITGIDEQVAAITKDKSFLFKAPDAPVAGTGKAGTAKAPVDDKIKNVFASFGVVPAGDK